ARVKAAEMPADTPSGDLPLNLPASYWRDLKAYDAGATAAGLKTRILVLQGERDYQVTMDDYTGWKKALKGHKGATLKSYPAVNHVYGEGRGKAARAESQKAGHAAGGVTDEGARGVKGRRGGGGRAGGATPRSQDTPGGCAPPPGADAPGSP